MESQLPPLNPQYEPGITPLELTRRHLQQWTDMLVYLHQIQAPSAEVSVCQSRIKQLEEDIAKLG